MSDGRREDSAIDGSRATSRDEIGAGEGPADGTLIPPPSSSVGGRGQKGVSVKIVRVVSALATVVVASALVAGTAVASSGAKVKIVPFTAAYAGKATVTITDGIADIKADGAGKASQIGAGKVTGVGTGAQGEGCVSFTGPGTMTGTAGKIAFKVVSGQGCGDPEGDIFSVSGKATVLTATGKLKKAKGTLRFSGTYNRGAGTFTIKFKGKLKQ
jgi:hypothetical protein